MKKFEIIAVREGSSTKTKAVRQGKAGGHKVLETITAISNGAALKQFNLRTESGIAEKAEVSLPPYETKKALFVDFNGVLDNPFDPNINTNERSGFLVPKLANKEKLYMLTRFALDNDLMMVFTSEHRNSGVSLYLVIARALGNSDNEEYSNFFLENKKEIRTLAKLSTENFGTRSNEISKFVKDHKITHCAVFEDYHRIDSELNPVMINKSTGLESKHIEKASEFLSL